ncbi:MAG: recombination mediator RecR [Pseudomonadota bacterium]
MTLMIDGPLDLLIRQLSTLPGLGRRSAKRIALHLLTEKEEVLLPLIKSMSGAADTIQSCELCGNLDEGNICRICRDPSRDRTSLCVVASVADLWAIERTRSYKGLYHVLGGVLSALDGVGPKDLSIDEMIENIEKNDIQEVILALSATVDGQSTAHYITDLIQDKPVTMTRLAQGMPMGGEVNYLDDNTIATALKSRANLR